MASDEPMIRKIEKTEIEKLTKRSQEFRTIACVFFCVQIAIAVILALLDSHPSNMRGRLVESVVYGSFSIFYALHKIAMYCFAIRRPGTKYLMTWLIISLLPLMSLLNGRLLSNTIAAYKAGLEVISMPSVHMCICLLSMIAYPLALLGLYLANRELQLRRVLQKSPDVFDEWDPRYPKEFERGLVKQFKKYASGVRWACRKRARLEMARLKKGERVDV